MPMAWCWPSARESVLGKKWEPGKLNWNRAIGVPPFPFHKPTHLFCCLECSPWMTLASLRTQHDCGRTGWVGWEGEKAADAATWPLLPQPRVGWEWAVNLKN